MDTAAFWWAIAATVLAGVQIFTQKIVAQEGRDSAFNGVWGYGISALLAGVSVLVAYGIPHNWLSIAALSLFAGFVHGIGSYARIESLKYIDTVIYFPINKVLGPIVVVAGGVWWFGDNLTLQQYIGIALSLSVPLLLVSSAEKHRQTNLQLGLVLLVISTLLTAFSGLLGKEGTTIDTTILFFMCLSQFAGAISSLLIYLKQKGLRGIRFSANDRRDFFLGGLNGVLQFLSFYSFLKAISLGLISIVYVIHAHYILIPIILSVWWYKEHINLRKLMAVIVSCLAIGLLYSP